MLGILGAAAGAVIGGLVGGGATVVSSLIGGHGLPSWSHIWQGVQKGALIGGVGTAAALFAVSVLGVALPTLGLGLAAGVGAAALYSLIFKHKVPSLETLGAGAVGGVFAGGALALALGALGFVGLGGAAGVLAAPTAIVGGTVAGGELAKEEMSYRQAMNEEKKLPPPAPIVVPGDSTPPSTNTPPSTTKGIANSLSGH